MASIYAGQLEARNIGSTIRFDWEGRRVFGVIAIVEKDVAAVDVTLGTSGDVYELDATEMVDIHLTAEANFLLHTKNTMEQLLTTIAGRPALVAV